jgi:hypothetical protein
MNLSPVSALLRKRIEENYDVYAVVSRLDNSIFGICSSRHQAERMKAELEDKGYGSVIKPWQLDKCAHA